MQTIDQIRRAWAYLMDACECAAADDAAYLPGALGYPGWGNLDREGFTHGPFTLGGTVAAGTLALTLSGASSATNWAQDANLAARMNPDGDFLLLVKRYHFEATPAGIADPAGAVALLGRTGFLSHTPTGGVAFRLNADSVLHTPGQIVGVEQISPAAALGLAQVGAPAIQTRELPIARAMWPKNDTITLNAPAGQTYNPAFFGIVFDDAIAIDVERLPDWARSRDKMALRRGLLDFAIQRYGLALVTRVWDAMKPASHA